MSIEYITEAEYERRFSRWSRGRKPASDLVALRHADKISGSATTLARCFAAGEPNAAHRHLRVLLKSAVWEVLRSEFDRKFVIGPTGPDRNCISFYAGWKDVP